MNQNNFMTQGFEETKNHRPKDSGYYIGFIYVNSEIGCLEVFWKFYVDCLRLIISQNIQLE